MSQFLLALDQGTTSSRAMVFDSAGQVLSSAQNEFTQIYPQSGWVEHDPEDIWRSQIAAANAALSEIDIDQVAALGITNQRETTILWDRSTGKPVHNAIVWQCRRTTPLCRELNESGAAQDVSQRTGLVIDPYFSGTKLAWLLDNVPGARERAEKGELAFGTVDSFLVWRLTGGRLHITDVSNASRTMLFNIHNLEWDPLLLDMLNIPRSVLPQVVPSSQVYGETDPDLFGRSIPIAGIAGDQQAATVGQVCFQPGMVKNTYGTGCFLVRNTGTNPIPSANGLLTTIGWQREGRPTVYALEGSVFIAGAVVQWLRDGLGLIERSSQIEELAQQVDDNGGVYLVPAFVGLGAPHWDPNARGTIVGLTRGSSAGHLARAALESIAFQTCDLVEAMAQDCGSRLVTLRADGGAAVNNLLMQFQADILNVPVEVPWINETTALGAAYLAGLAVGVWQDESELSQMDQVAGRFEPSMSQDQRSELLAGWRKALDRAVNWAT